MSARADRRQRHFNPAACTRRRRGTQRRAHDRRPDHRRQPRTMRLPCAGLALTAFLLVVLVCCGGAARVGPSETPTGARNVTASTVRPVPLRRAAPTTVTTPTRKLGEARDYFIEVALGAEYGGAPPEIHKWAVDPKISVHGDPTPQDLATLAEVVADLNEIISTINIEVIDSGASVDLHFAPEWQFANIEPNYVPGNNGFFWIRWDGGGNITTGRVLVSTELSQSLRNHVIREEVTQMLGLMNDSFSYPDSIFYEWPSTTQSYSDLDEYVIEALYRPQITAGIDIDEALAVIGE